MSIAVLDEKPVVAVAAVALAVVPHAHNHPAALQLLASKREFEFPFPKRTFGIVPVFRRPEAAVPEHYGSATVLALRDGAFEVPIVERMVLDLHGQPAVARIERGTFGNGPGLENAVHL